MPLWLVKGVVSGVSSMPLLFWSVSVCFAGSSFGSASVVLGVISSEGVVVLDQRVFAPGVAENIAIGCMNVRRANRQAISCRVARDLGVKAARMDFGDLFIGSSSVMVPLRCWA